MNLSVIVQTSIYPDNLPWFKVRSISTIPQNKVTIATNTRILPSSPGQLCAVYGDSDVRDRDVAEQPGLPQSLINNDLYTMIYNISLQGLSQSLIYDY